MTQSPNPKGLLAKDPPIIFLQNEAVFRSMLSAEPLGLLQDEDIG